MQSDRKATDQQRYQDELSRQDTVLDAQSDLIDTMAAEAAKQWTGTFNPRPLTAAEFGALYRAAW